LQSQTSFASSLPASQLPLETQDESQAEEEIVSGAGGLSIHDDGTPIDPGRVAVFRTALGQLLSTDLFQDDSASLAAVTAAVNGKIHARDGGAFGREEAVKALKELEKLNHIM